jgi:hypothetical protein
MKKPSLFFPKRIREAAFRGKRFIPDLIWKFKLPMTEETN